VDLTMLLFGQMWYYPATLCTTLFFLKLQDNLLGFKKSLQLLFFKEQFDLRQF
jgi:uncharacterized membrane protein